MCNLNNKSYGNKIDYPAPFYCENSWVMLCGSLIENILAGRYEDAGNIINRINPNDDQNIYRFEYCLCKARIMFETGAARDEIEQVFPSELMEVFYHRITTLILYEQWDCAAMFVKITGKLYDYFDIPHRVYHLYSCMVVDQYAHEGNNLQFYYEEMVKINFEYYEELAGFMEFTKELYEEYKEREYPGLSETIYSCAETICERFNLRMDLYLDG